jgi:uncharacterized protein (UPF0332 family)
MNPDDVKVLVEYRMKESRTALADAEFLASSNRSSQGIVNRAYYAMFYAVLALAQLRGQVPAKHSGALGLFDREFVHTGIFPREMSKHLHAAFEYRQTSDYQVTQPAGPEETVEMLSNARAFIEHVGKWLESQESAGVDSAKLRDV